MIVCSCNAVSDRTIRAELAATEGCCIRVSDVFERIDRRPQCGRCAKTIRDMIRAHTAACDPRDLAACPAEPDLLLAAE